MANDKADTPTFLDFCGGLLASGARVRFSARGNSMAPAICDGDIVVVEPVLERQLRRGDVVLFAVGGRLGLHRLVTADDQNDIYVTRGDACEENDLPMCAAQILGRAVSKEQRVGTMVRQRAVRGVRVTGRRLLSRGTRRFTRVARRVMSSVAALNLFGILCFLLALSSVGATSKAFGQCAVPGKDGDGGTLTGIVNTYYPGTATAAAGSTSISVGSPTGASTPISAGDLLLVIQMQDADISYADTNAYGSGVGGRPYGSSAVNSTGLYEFVKANGSVTGGSVSIAGNNAGGLINTYHYNAGSTTATRNTFEVIRVPQYSGATLGSGLTALPWNGSTGGVLAVDVAGNLDLGSATVSVDGLGFRGGAGMQLSGNGNAGTYVWYAPTAYSGTPVAGNGGSKGEGIAGTPRWVEFNQTYLNTGFEYPGGSMGRGGPGNAGGGGDDSAPAQNSQNSGGGGGGNGGAGGLGGNSWNANDAVGGYGGAAYTPAIGRIIMGGGGGAGARNNDDNDNQASSGAAGGGIVILRAESLSGTGTITANGASAYNDTLNDGAGGGGAGGSVVVVTGNNITTGLTIQANGGRGGNAWAGHSTNNADRHGPGGGGGGGVIYTSGTPTSRSVTGGAAGITTGNGTDTYGAAGGVVGRLTANVADNTIPGYNSGAECAPDLSITSTHTDGQLRGTSFTYTLTITNVATVVSTSGTVTVTDVLPTGLILTGASGATWSCTTSQQTATCTTSSVIAPNASYSAITINATVAQTAPDQVINVATVSGGGDVYMGNNTANDVTNLVSLADLALTTVAPPATVAAGSAITYSHTLANNGPSDATGAVFMEAVPAGTTFQSMTSTPGWTCTTPAVGGTGTITCTNPNFASTETANISVLVTVPAGTASGTLITETAQIGSLTQDDTAANNKVTTYTSVSTTAPGQADLEIVPTSVNRTEVVAVNAPSADITIVYTVTNNGPAATTANSTSLTINLTRFGYRSIAAPTGWTCTNPGRNNTGQVRCTVAAAVASGWSDNFTIVVRGVNTGTETIAATVAAANDQNTLNNTAQVTVAAVAAATGYADVALASGGSPSVVVPGGYVTYTHVITNNGLGAANAIAFSQTLPANTYFQSVAIPESSVAITCGSMGGQTVTCNVAPGLAQGSSLNLTFTVKTDPSASGSITSTASVTETGDPISTNNSTTIVTSVDAPKVDMILATTPAPLSVLPGGDITYTHTVTNTGPSTATNAVFAQSIPSGITFVSVTPSDPGWDCTAGLPCTRAGFVPGAPVTFAVVLKANASLTPGTLIASTSSISSAVYETKPDDNTTYVSVNVSGTGLADLSVTNAASPAGVYGGNNVTYTQTVTNAGAADATSVRLTDVLPANTTFVSFSAPAGWSCSTPAVGSGGTVTCDIATLAASASAQFTLVLKVDSSMTAGPLVQTATVSSSTDDPNRNNNSASASVQVGTQADIGVSISAPTVTTNGAALTFTEVLVNRGPSTATNVVFTQNLPTNATAQPSAPPPGWNCTGAGPITCTVASLPPGTVSYPLQVTVTGTATDHVVDTVSVTSGTPDPTSMDHDASADVLIVNAGQYDLAVTNVGSPDLAPNATDISYVQQVTNSGPASVTPTLSGNVPLNTTFVSMAVPLGWNCPTLPVPGGTGAYSCTATSILPSGESASFTFVVKVNSQVPPGATITDTVSVSPTTNDPIAANNSATSRNKVTSSAEADMTVSLTGSDTVVQGNNISYTAVVTNRGPAIATNVALSDALPSADLSFVSVTVTGGVGGTCSASGGAVSCSIASLNSGTSATITIVATALTPNAITNTVSVSADQSDPDINNNSASTTSAIMFPTAVRLMAFEATQMDGGVLLQWSTGGESHNLGFNVYREENGDRVRINTSLIAGSALRFRRASESQSAKTYAFADTSSSTGHLAHWLEDVDLNGVRTMHGPVYARPAGSTTLAATAGNNSNDPALSRSSATLAQMSARQPGLSPARSHFVGQRPIIPAPGAGSAAQQLQFTLAASNALKVSVDHEGWYRLPLSSLAAAGLRVQNQQQLHLFAEGVEQPMLIKAVNGATAIEFYGTGMDTQYSDTRVYWLLQGASGGASIQQQVAYGQSGLQPRSFIQQVELRDKTTFFAALITSDGNNFFGDIVSTSPIDQLLETPDIAANDGQPATLEIALQGVIAGAEHDVEVAFNGSVLGHIGFSGQSQGSFKAEVPLDLLKNGLNTVTLAALNGDDDLSLVDHITLNYPRAYVAKDDGLRFTADSGNSVTVTGFRTTPSRLVDITDPADPVLLLPNVKQEGDGSFSMELQVPFYPSGLHTMLAVADDAISSPVKLIRNNPSRLHAAQLGADVVMISHPALMSALAPLADRRRRTGYTVSVVAVDDVYDEFSFGEKNPQALRDFLAAATSTWIRKPHYLVLAGDASFDPLNHLGMGSFDFVPTKLVPTAELMTASDDWFSDFDNTGVGSISTGRLPARTVADLQLLVSKIVSYESADNNESWRQQVLMVADTDDEENFTADSASVERLLPSRFQVTEILAGQGDTATARNTIISEIEAGKLVVNYIGHGSVEQWSESDLLDVTSASSLGNGTRLPVFLVMNCLNGYFFDVYQQSMAEALLLAPNGGGIAVIASSGLTEPGPQVELDRNVVRLLSGDSNPALGDVLRLAKAGVEDQDVRRTYMLFGDPAMRLDSLKSRPRLPVFPVRDARGHWPAVNSEMK